jgi:poly(hydroxyalkanoate) depolymerase family esterase
MNDTLQNLMRAATRMTQTGRLTEATEAIRRALNGAAAGRGPAASNAAAADVPATPASGLILDGCVFEVAPPPPAAAQAPAVDAVQARWRPAPDIFRPAAPTGRGEFSHGTCTHASPTRRYKVYAPPDHSGRQLPLVVMLHGCTQDPDDFATGTGMNERAREQGFFVLYPAQSQDANPSRCWNWFKHEHQRRDHGEPALIASMTRALLAQHSIDPRRVYIAGLSAGGAMAAIVAAAYPELFAALGVHSGLPCGAASDMVGALAVMKSGSAGPARTPTASVRSASVPTIVFHGDQDRTVHARNGQQVISAALANAHAAGSPRIEQGVSQHGRRYTRSTHLDGKGQALAEHWLVHGAGHAWSGGDAKGSYTDAKGPDATLEMLRFFREHPQQPVR